MTGLFSGAVFAGMKEMNRFLFPVVMFFAGTLIAAATFFSLLQKKEDKEPVHLLQIQEIQAIGKLELVKYTIKDIIEKEEIKHLLPNPKAILIVEGEVTGCLNLTLLRKEQIHYQGDSIIEIELPKPEICYVKVNHQKSRVYDIQHSYLADQNLVSDAFRHAETQILQYARQNGIEQQTRQQAQLFLKPMLEAISKRKVILRFP